MATSSNLARRTIGRLLQGTDLKTLVEKIAPVSTEDRPLPPAMPGRVSWSSEARGKRLEYVQQMTGCELPYLSGSQSIDPEFDLRGTIENQIGMTMIPTGVIGPLRVNGTAAGGDYFVPMATTEGALVASYHRGASLISRSGGASSICLTESVGRSPCFSFTSFAESGSFLIWALSQVEEFNRIVSENSSHAELAEVRPNIEGNRVSLLLEFSTGDAAGQNMVTRCTEAICNWIVENTPVTPRVWYVEGNLSGDKKATALSFTSVRGKKVVAECVVPRPLVTQVLRTTPEVMLDYWSTSVLNGVQSGSIGVNGHFANGLAALFLACGQDVACVAEAAVGTTRFELTSEGDLYSCVTLPGLIVGTIGGGTWLPTQRECLQMLDCTGEGSARKFAEICAALILGGELSIVGAIAGGHFAKAHRLFGSRRRGNV